MLSKTIYRTLHHMDAPSKFCRFAVGARGRNVFTRTQQAEIFRGSYRELPVHCRWLRNQGNFKGLFTEAKGRVRNIPKITNFRAFRIERIDGEVAVSVKEFMHSPYWAGFDEHGQPAVGAPPHQVFPGGVPRLQDAPPFKLKELDGDIIRKIERRYKASRPRLRTRYFDGKLRLFCFLDVSGRMTSLTVMLVSLTVCTLMCFSQLAVFRVCLPVVGVCFR